MGDYVCDKCPRTFKLEEFYERHKKVHELKKQHRCHLCGFVYGAAKGLEGHLRTHEEEIDDVEDEERLAQAAPPFPLNFFFLGRQGVLTQNAAPEAHHVVIPKGREKSVSSERESSDADSKPSSPAGTGCYDVYDSVPDVGPQNDSGFFVCTICSREFSGLNSLKKHLPIHTRRVQHQCDTCGHVFGKKEYLLDHMRKHTGAVSPVCEVCGQTFNKSLKLKEHFKLHRNPDAEGGSFNNNNNSALPFRCHICRDLFRTATALGKHLNVAHAETLYRCDMCDATFGDVRGKNHHMYNEHQMDAFHQKCVWCPVCNQGFTRQYNLKVHMYKAHGKEYIENNFTEAELAALTKPQQPRVVPEPKVVASIPRGFPEILACHLCNDKFIRRDDLHIHLEATHRVPILKCAVCGEPFTSTVELNEHLASVHDEPPHLSMLEGSRRPGPASRTNAPVESRVISTNVPGYLLDASSCDKNNFECGECGKVLQHKQSFVSHMRVIHGNYYGGNKWKGSSVVDLILDESAKNSPKNKKSGGKNGEANATMCSVCEQVFPNPSSLRNHVVNVHINGQDHTCDLCGKAFLSQENLDSHIKSKHPNLHKRIQSLRDALGLEEDEPEPKKVKIVIDEPKAEVRKPAPYVEKTIAKVSPVVSALPSPSTPFVLDLSMSSKSSFTNNNNEGEGPFVFGQPNQPQTQVATGGGRKKHSVCKVCGVVLSPKTNVNVHMRTHSGARPYQCVLCLNKFRQKAHLMKHFRCSHNQKRPPFVCLFCPDECSSSNDLYRHITDKHKKETDELIKVNGLSAEASDDESQADETSKGADEEQQDEVVGEEIGQVEEDDEMLIDESEEASLKEEASSDVPASSNEETNMSSAEDESKDQTVQSSSLALNFVRDEEVEEIKSRSSEAQEDDDEDGAGELTIDESPEEPEEAPKTKQKPRKSLGGKRPLAKKPSADTDSDEKTDSDDGDTNQPLSLVSVKRIKSESDSEVKAEEEEEDEEEETLAPTGEGNAQPTLVNDYESRVQNDLWPVNCIKCSAHLTNLESFNAHMNDHWSDDKCCPVCGLLINSKRFNFKQHLKIHTGEKPFVCSICQRSFRQKAHMVKHVTTHRTGGNDAHALAVN